jgi:RNA polymerase sigma-70 factor, ECF subfamily
LEQVDDLALIRSIARRDRAAFEALYYRYAPRLGRYACKLLKRREAVDEVIDDVMLVVWRDAARFDAGVSTLSAWLFGITHHKVLKMLDRSRTRTREVPLEAGGGEGMAESMEGSAHDPERAAMGRQLGTALANALERLPPEQRAVLELAFGEGKSYQEIAEVMACPVNTVKTRMFHARKRLAGFLDEEQDEKSKSRLR